MSLAMVITTLANSGEAQQLAASLVDERLAACVHMKAVTSVYRWEGKVETAEEVRLECKTAQAAVEALIARIEALHPYDLPQILVLKAEASRRYTDWVIEETGDD